MYDDHVHVERTSCVGLVKLIKLCYIFPDHATRYSRKLQVPIFLTFVYLLLLQLYKRLQKHLLCLSPPRTLATVDKLGKDHDANSRLVRSTTLLLLPLLLPDPDIPGKYPDQLHVCMIYIQWGPVITANNYNCSSMKFLPPF